MWMKKWYYYLPFIVSLCLCCLLTSSHASAVSGSTTYGVVEGWATYYDSGGWHFNVPDGAQSLPYQILGAPSSLPNKQVSWSRFRLNFSAYGSTSNLYNMMEVKLTIVGGSMAYNSWLMSPSGIFKQSSGSDVTANCSTTNVSSSGFEIICKATLARSSQLTGFDIQTYPADNITESYGMTSPGSSAIRLSQILVSYEGTEDPNTAILEGISNQNNTIINQNNTTNNLLGDVNDNLQDIADRTSELSDSVQDVNDTLKDDTVDTSNIDYSDITDSVPAFGPIATIVNSLIDFPRVFLTDDLCQPLNTPIPEYMGASDSTYLVIPCPSDFLEPYWDAVVLIESIAAAYIYFRLAIFIVRQVEYIRDPERDDEEFLNL